MQDLKIIRAPGFPQTHASKFYLQIKTPKTY